MIDSARIHPLNSVIFISDPDGGVVPEWVEDRLILSTPSCISVGCYPEPDGPTEILLGEAMEIGPDRKPDFDGELETPKRIVGVFTTERQTILSRTVPDRRTRIRIWVSHPRWPERILIGFG
jgi:hypothetical protein